MTSGRWTGGVACKAACRRLLPSFATVGLLGFLVGACAQASGTAAAQASQFEVEVSVRDGEEPVAGAELWADKVRLGVTGESGLSRVTLQGEEGQHTELTVRCPEGFLSPAAPLRFAMRSLMPGSKAPRFESLCARSTHRVVVGIRAQNARDLPIYYLDQVVGRTDAFGVSHVVLSVLPAQQVTLTLDTTSDPKLLPHSPKLTFVAPERSELVLMEQKFTRERARAKAPKRVVQGPQRL